MPTIKQQVLDDLDAVFDAGLAVDITHVNGATNETIKGFFDDPYQTGLVGDAEFNNPAPAIFIQTADCGNVDENSEFTISGTVYYVIEIEPDNEGMKKINLSKDSNK